MVRGTMGGVRCAKCNGRKERTYVFVWGTGQVGHEERVRGSETREAHARGTGRIDG